MFKIFKKKTFKVSWTKIAEMGYEGKGMYCQHNLAEDTARYLADILIKSGEYANVIVTEDVG